MKKLFSFILALTIVSLSVLPAFAADGEPRVGVVAFGSEKTAVYLQKNEKDGMFYLYLPSDCSETALRAVVPEGTAVSVDGKELVNGEETDVFTPGDHAVSIGGTEGSLRVLRSADLPSLFIDTESGSLEKIHANKEHKEKGVLTLIDKGALSIDSAALKSVKGRGNSTWAGDKKPYNIKFDAKTDVLGMGKAKKWSLLANHFDSTLLRNSICFDLAESFGLRFTPSYRTVDLYMNGEYQGNYIIVESVEVGETRVDITDLESANEDANPGSDIENAYRGGDVMSNAFGTEKWVNIYSPADISGGYLLETEMPSRYLMEVCGFVTENGQPIVLKSPEFASREEVEYIAKLFSEADNAIVSPTGMNELGRSYTEYFDMDQLVKMYILTEYSFHRDAGMSSCYFYKDVGSDVLHAGPAWDFDLSLGNTEYSGKMPFSVKDPGSWWANAMSYRDDDNKTPTIFTRLYRHEAFRDLVTQEWTSCSEAISAELDKLPDMIDSVCASAVMNAFRWDLLTGDTAEEREKAYRAECEDLLDFASKRMTALSKGFAADGAEVYYDANGGSGLVYNGEMLSVGDSVTAREVDHKVTPILPPSEDETFDCWNTERDGSGRSVSAGEKLELTGRTTVLYAQWKNKYIPKIASEKLLRSYNDDKLLLVKDTIEYADIPFAFADLNFTFTRNGEPTAETDKVTTGDLMQILREDGSQTLEYTVVLLNDADGNGKINSADARLALRYAAKLDKPERISAVAADSDENGKVTSADARLILRIAAHLPADPAA